MGFLRERDSTSYYILKRFKTALKDDQLWFCPPDATSFDSKDAAQAYMDKVSPDFPNYHFKIMEVTIRYKFVG